jgi:hypothetical protein
VSLCPSPVELSRLYSESSGAGEPAAGLAEHLATCPACAEAWEGMAELSRLARLLPSKGPDRARVEELRTSLLAEAERDQGRWRRPLGRPTRWLAAAALAAVVAGGAGLWRLGRPERRPVMVTMARLTRPASSGIADAAVPRSWATLQSSPGAEFSRSDDEDPDEVVHLRQGLLRVDVQKLPPGRRYRVITGDGEVEVRGTRFEVAAEKDRLARVTVLSGRVAIRRYRRPVEGDGGRGHGGGTADERGREMALAEPESLVLGPGEFWEAGAVAAASAPAALEAPSAQPVPAPPPPAVVPSRRVHPVRRAPAGHPPAAKVVTPAPAPASPPASGATVATAPAAPASGTAAEQEFRQGWTALREGDLGRAARAFERAVRLDPTDSIVEDARFWRAVALVRARRSPEAEVALRLFLQKHPASPRFGEASVTLGWLLLDRGDRQGARGLFEAARHDRVASVRASARSGLARLQGPAAAPAPASPR